MKTVRMDRSDRVLEIREEDIPVMEDLNSHESGFVVELEKGPTEPFNILDVSIYSFSSISPTISVPIVTPILEFPKQKSMTFFNITILILN